MNVKVVGIFSLFCILFGTPSSLAEEQITISTNKDYFSAGEIVAVSGTVNSSFQLVAIEIKDADGNTILVRSIESDAQGNFELEFKVPSTAQSGKLEILANAQVAGEQVTTTKEITQSHESTTTQVNSQPNKGGCLIATATYDSELAPQVQQLRELRDNQLLQTESGINFMAGFNQFYYSFSPTIADWERENLVFKEAVKIMITPMISSLSILNYVDMDSEASVLGYGISLIILNLGMYFVAPAIVIHTIRKKF